MRFIQVAVMLFCLSATIGSSDAGTPLDRTVQSETGEKSKSTPSTPTGEELFKRGIERQEFADYLGAIADYTVFLTTHPDRVDALTNRGFARAMTNDLQGAIADFDRAIELSPSDAEIYNARGNARAMAGNIAASIRDFNRAIAYNRELADAYYNRGISRHSLGDRRGARADISRAAKLFLAQRDIGGYQQASEWMQKLK